jgi:hypothetical protein
MANMNRIGSPQRTTFQMSVGERGWQVRYSSSRYLEETGGAADELPVSWTPINQVSSYATREGFEGLRAALAGSRLLRLDPDELRKPTALISDADPLSFDEHGLGLPGVYDAILVRDMRGYLAINERLRELFPAVDQIYLRNPSQQLKALGVKLRDGTVVGAEDMSEGLLYYLAFAALPYLTPVAMVLIEEPENGLHPARVAEVMRVLREISKQTQVILATHSPLVVNELEGHEVTVLRRSPEQGTSATLLSDTPRYAERSKIYANGELWLSYADGVSEADLLDGAT